MSSDFYIDTHNIPEPAKFDVKRKEIGVSQRLANGRMVKDVIATKKTFTLSWPFLTWEYLREMVTLFETGDFFTFLYPHGGALNNSATVTIADIGPEPLQYIETAADDWGYRDISLTLEEQ